MLTRHIRESLQVTPGPFPDFWVGPGDEAMASPSKLLHCASLIPRQAPGYEASIVTAQMHTSCL